MKNPYENPLQRGSLDFFRPRREAAAWQKALFHFGSLLVVAGVVGFFAFGFGFYSWAMIWGLPTMMWAAISLIVATAGVFARQFAGAKSPRVEAPGRGEPGSGEPA